MKTETAHLWKQARSLADIGALTARWLEGDIESQASYEPNCGPEEETAPLITVLAKLNRVGVYTTNSQPGEPEKDPNVASWCQRAAVEGFAEESVAERLVAAALTAGLIASTSWRSVNTCQSIEVSREDGAGFTWFGRHLDREHLRVYYAEHLSADGLAALVGATQFVVVDPVWGRVDSPLWPMLHRFANRLAAAS